VDAARGLAVLLMVAYHVGFDLDLLGVVSLTVQGGWYDYLGNAIAGLFLLVVGVSLSISYHRARRRHGPWPALRRRLRRAAWIAAAAGLVTLASWLFDPDRLIFFGILHLIALGMVLALPWVGRPRAAALAGLGLLAAGPWLTQARFSFSGLAWLGFRPANLATLDYYPVVPWLGLVLVGVAAGDRAYPCGRGPVWWRWNGGPPAGKWLPLMGRHSLAIYLVHQPVLIGLIGALGAVL
jgi:uncharacterized membrane protein